MFKVKKDGGQGSRLLFNVNVQGQKSRRSSFKTQGQKGRRSRFNLKKEVTFQGQGSRSNRKRLRFKVKV